jgi:hypothetical protein
MVGGFVTHELGWGPDDASAMGPMFSGGPLVSISLVGESTQS